jgi:hypothetical protein
MKVLFILFFLVNISNSFAQKKETTDPTTDSILDTKKVNDHDTIFHNYDETAIPAEEGVYYFLNNKEFWLGVIVLFLLFAILIIEALVIKNRNFTDEASIRLLIVTIVLIGSLFLFVSGYSDKQIAPAFGLFGTICGYLLGRSNTATKEKNEI